MLRPYRPQHPGFAHCNGVLLGLRAPDPRLGPAPTPRFFHCNGLLLGLRAPDPRLGPAPTPRAGRFAPATPEREAALCDEVPVASDRRASEGAFLASSHAVAHLKGRASKQLALRSVFCALRSMFAVLRFTFYAWGSAARKTINRRIIGGYQPLCTTR
jgi:hypothetical protein